jgi:gluconate 2-dehydrogenase gamma chain
VTEDRGWQVVGGDGIDRREAIATMALGALAVYGVPRVIWAHVRPLVAQGSWQPLFFTPAQVKQLRVLVDMILPRDERSGSAEEAGAVEYIDFFFSDAYDETLARLKITPIGKVDDRRLWRDGLSWLDAECHRRFGRPFVSCEEPQRALVLDEIAWPARARPELAEAVRFFNQVRDLSAAAFFSSKIGVQDLGYLGGVGTAEWRGAPEAALKELGVSYDEWDRKYGK